MQSLIEQVERAAEAKAHYARTGSSVLFDDLARGKLDWEHLLAHMQAQQAVVDAAIECGAALSMVAPCYCSTGGRFKCSKCKALNQLNAALAAKGSQ